MFEAFCSVLPFLPTTCFFSFLAQQQLAPPGLCRPAKSYGSGQITGGNQPQAAYQLTKSRNMCLTSEQCRKQKQAGSCVKDPPETHGKRAGRPLLHYHTAHLTHWICACAGSTGRGGGPLLLTVYLLKSSYSLIAFTVSLHPLVQSGVFHS